jgi:hypothetical protein
MSTDMSEVSGEDSRRVRTAGIVETCSRKEMLLVALTKCNISHLVYNYVIKMFRSEAE